MAMFGNGNKSFDVECVSGGWIFKWRNPSAADAFHERKRHYVSYPDYEREPKTSGTEIFTDKKKLTKRIADFVG